MSKVTNSRMDSRARTDLGSGKRAVAAGLSPAIAFRLKTPGLARGTDRANSGGLGPDGNLYVSGGTFGGNLGVRRYDSTTGAFIDFFANTGSDLYVPIGITFGPDNNLYVATQNAANAQLWLTLFFVGRKHPRTSPCLVPMTSIAETRSGVSARRHRLFRRT
jgi:hypothetical protein